MKKIWAYIKTIGSLVLLIMGIIWLPKDIKDLSEAYKVWGDIKDGVLLFIMDDILSNGLLIRWALFTTWFSLTYWSMADDNKIKIFLRRERKWPWQLISDKNKNSPQKMLEKAESDESKLANLIIGSNIPPKLEIKVDDRITESTKTVNFVKNTPTIELTITFIPNRSMLFTHLFLKIKGEEIEPLVGSVYNKQLQLPLRISQTECYKIRFPISTEFSDKYLEGRILAIAEGVEWKSDDFVIRATPVGFVEIKEDEGDDSNSLNKTLWIKEGGGTLRLAGGEIINPGQVFFAREEDLPKNRENILKPFEASTEIMKKVRKALQSPIRIEFEKKGYDKQLRQDLKRYHCYIHNVGSMDIKNVKVDLIYEHDPNTPHRLTFLTNNESSIDISKDGHERVDLLLYVRLSDKERLLQICNTNQNININDFDFDNTFTIKVVAEGQEPQYKKFAVVINEDGITECIIRYVEPQLSS